MCNDQFINNILKFGMLFGSIGTLIVLFLIFSILHFYFRKKLFFYLNNETNTNKIPI